MRQILITLAIVFAVPFCALSQSYPHYTMFMFNKLMYNPAYAGNKNLTTVNAIYRSQWVNIDGAPRAFSVAIDGPVGNYMQPFRRVALGLSVSNERLGVTNNTSLMGYYAYRIPFERSVLSLGLQAGTSFYNAEYSKLNPYQQNDQVLTENVKNAFLPNAGAGAYWSGDNFYAGIAVPNLIQNFYDKDNKTISISSRQIRSYYLSGGYIFTLNDVLKLQPQVLARYAGNGQYNLPFNSDINLSLIAYDRFLIGATYRTDKSLEAIVHMQVTNSLNIGYSFDYTMSQLKGYNGGSHEIVAGFDFIKDRNKYASPRFIKLF